MNKDHDNCSVPEENCKKRTFSSRIVRFAAWWFGYSSLLASTTPCPFCGRGGCPTGIGISGLLGALFAFLTSRGEKGSDNRSRQKIKHALQYKKERTIRRMADELEEDLSSEVSEALSRLEAGEDPEKIERELEESGSGMDNTAPSCDGDSTKRDTSGSLTLF